jgi:hypothetical protein
MSVAVLLLEEKVPKADEVNLKNYPNRIIAW